MQVLEVTQIFWQSLVVGLICSLVATGVLVLTKRWHGAFSMDSASGIQKFHTTPTPRVGGIALVFGAIGAWFSIPEASAGAKHLLSLLLLGGTPAFFAGIVEDITKKVSVKIRLIATALSGLVFALLSGYWINAVSIPGVDILLALAPIGMIFTAFAISGIANSVNIIDGFNGLATGVVVLMLLTLSVIAFKVGDVAVLNLALVGVVVVLGFMVWNFPRGLIFLGDAGAYSLGYYVAALAVALTLRNTGEVSPWAMLLVCGYPIIETLFSVYRRLTRKRRRSPGAPDASHLHSLVYRRVVSRKLMPHAPAWQRNAMTSPFMWAYAAVPMLGAVFWPQSLAMVLVWLVFSFFVYQRTYRRMVAMSIFFIKPSTSQ